MQEKENVRDILVQARKAIKEEDIALIASLSDRTIHTASVTQDPDNINIAVVVYALSKTLARKRYEGFKGWHDFYRRFNKAIEDAIAALEKDDIKKFRQANISIRNAIEKLSGKLKIYIKDIFQKARISKASRLYEHGLSMEQTARLLGISLWELSEYEGQTGVSEMDVNKTLDTAARVKIAMEFFR